MKNSLEKEAEELFPINSTGGSMEMLNRHQLNNSLKQEGFIAGANSKYVQIEKIKAQIEVLKELEPSDYDCEYSNLREYRNKIRKKKYKNFNKS